MYLAGVALDDKGRDRARETVNGEIVTTPVGEVIAVLEAAGCVFNDTPSSKAP